MQQFDGGASAGCQADDSQAIAAPRKMLCPFLSVWSKQTDRRLRQRIVSRLFRPFEFIAAITGQTEIVNARIPAFGQGNDMIDQHRDSDNFRALTIAATMPCEVSDAGANLL